MEVLVKPHLEAIAKDPAFLPEIARRFADPAYTNRLAFDVTSLLTFFREPKEHLMQVLNELSKNHRAALTLIFLHEGFMPVGNANSSLQQLVVKYFGVDAEATGQALNQLINSFVIQKTEDNARFWTFKHPTIFDALSAILAETDGMAELYLRGATPKAILSEVVCEGVSEIEDAIVIGSQLSSLLVARLTNLEDEKILNRQLFAFLAQRASDEVFKQLVGNEPNIFDRDGGSHWAKGYHPRVLAMARAHQLGLLPAEKRNDISEELVSALFYRDVSFLDDESVLALIHPTTLITLGGRIRDDLVATFSDVVEEVIKNIDYDVDASDHFDEARAELRAYERILGGDESSTEAIASAEEAISDGVAEVQRKIEEHSEKPDLDEWEWTNYVSRRSDDQGQSNTPPQPRVASSQRSIFSDVDE